MDFISKLGATWHIVVMVMQNPNLNCMFLDESKMYTW